MAGFGPAHGSGFEVTGFGVGAFVIVQDGTPEERAMFHDAVDRHIPGVARQVYEDVASVA